MQDHSLLWFDFRGIFLKRNCHIRYISINCFLWPVSYTHLDVYKRQYKYGFIKRYPDNKIEITGVNNEPWHYRYVGVDAALEIDVYKRQAGNNQ